jgi:hypothetical protein
MHAITLSTTIKRVNMKFKFSAAIAAAVFFMTVAVISCKKENSSQVKVSDAEAQTMSQEEAAAEGEYDELTEMGLTAGADMEAGAIDNGRIATDGNSARIRIELFVNLKLRLGTCVNITAEPNDTTFPKTITIDYGNGCLCWDGKFRKGKVKLHFSAPIRKPGAVITITLQDYYVNRAHIEGVKTITNLSANGAISYSVKIENGKVTWPNGRGFAYAGIKTVTQVEGMGTLTCLDDVWSIEGRATVTYANGVTVTKNTESALIKPVACNWITKGVLKITINDRVLYVDFGTGASCDNKAVLTWANGQVEFTLP